jgi:hypothetical protein
LVATSLKELGNNAYEGIQEHKHSSSSSSQDDGKAAKSRGGGVKFLGHAALAKVLSGDASSTSNNSNSSSSSSSANKTAAARKGSGVTNGSASPSLGSSIVQQILALPCLPWEQNQSKKRGGSSSRGGDGKGIVLLERVQRVSWWEEEAAVVVENKSEAAESRTGSKGEGDDVSPGLSTFDDNGALVDGSSVSAAATVIPVVAAAAASADVVTAATTASSETSTDGGAANQGEETPKEFKEGERNKKEGGDSSLLAPTQMPPPPPEKPAPLLPPSRFCMVRVTLHGLKLKLECYEPQSGDTFSVELWSPFAKATTKFKPLTPQPKLPIPPPSPSSSLLSRSGAANMLERKKNKRLKEDNASETNSFPSSDSTTATAAGEKGAGGGGKGKGGKGARKTRGASSSSSSFSAARVDTSALMKEKKEAEAKAKVAAALAQQEFEAGRDHYEEGMAGLASLIADDALGMAYLELQAVEGCNVVPQRLSPEEQRLKAEKQRAQEEMKARAALAYAEALDHPSEATQRRKLKKQQEEEALSSLDGFSEVAAVRREEWEANRGPPKDFFSRLIVTDVLVDVKPVQVALRSWQTDLWRVLGAPRNACLRKLNVLGGSGATIVCRDHTNQEEQPNLDVMTWTREAAVKEAKEVRRKKLEEEAKTLKRKKRQRQQLQRAAAASSSSSSSSGLRSNKDNTSDSLAKAGMLDTVSEEEKGRESISDEAAASASAAAAAAAAAKSGSASASSPSSASSVSSSSSSLSSSSSTAATGERKGANKDDDEEGLEIVDWGYNRKASKWTGSPVFGPAIWVVSASGRSAPATTASFDEKAKQFIDDWVLAAKERKGRLLWRDRRLKERRRKFDDFLRQRNDRLAPFLVRSCLAKGAMGCGIWGGLLSPCEEPRHRGKTGQRQQGFGTATLRFVGSGHADLLQQGEEAKGNGDGHSSSSHSSPWGQDEAGSWSTGVDAEALAVAGKLVDLITENDASIRALVLSCGEAQPMRFYRGTENSGGGNSEETKGGGLAKSGRSGLGAAVSTSSSSPLAVVKVGGVQSERDVRKIEGNIQILQRNGQELRAQVEELPPPLQAFVAARLNRRRVPAPEGSSGGGAGSGGGVVGSVFGVTAMTPSEAMKRGAELSAEADSKEGKGRVPKLIANDASAVEETLRAQTLPAFVPPSLEARDHEIDQGESGGFGGGGYGSSSSSSSSSWTNNPAHALLSSLSSASNNAAAAAAASISAFPAPSLAGPAVVEYCETPHVEMKHLHALRRAAEATTPVDRVDPFAAFKTVVPPDEKDEEDDDNDEDGVGGGDEEVDGGGDDAWEGDEGTTAAAAASASAAADGKVAAGGAHRQPASARDPPPLEPDSEWESELPVPDECRPWTWWVSLMAQHATSCAIPPGACPVPCCGRARVLARQKLVAEAMDLLAAASGSNQKSRRSSSLAARGGAGVAEGGAGVTAATVNQAQSAVAAASAPNEVGNESDDSDDDYDSDDDDDDDSFASSNGNSWGGDYKDVLNEDEDDEEDLGTVVGGVGDGLRMTKWRETVRDCLERCYRDRVAEEARNQLVGPERSRVRQERASVAASQGEQGLAKLAEVEAQREAALAAEGATAKRRLRRLFRTVAWTVVRLLRNAAMAKSLRESGGPLMGFHSTRKELAEALGRLKGVGGVRVPIHDAVGLELPGDLSFLESERPLARLEVDMHQLPRLLGFDGLGPLQDMPKRRFASASEDAVSTFDLEARFDSTDAVTTEGDKEEVEMIKEQLGLGDDASGAQILSELVLKHLRLANTTVESNSNTPPTLVTSSSSDAKSSATNGGGGGGGSGGDDNQGWNDDDDVDSEDEWASTGGGNSSAAQRKKKQKEQQEQKALQQSSPESPSSPAAQTASQQQQQQQQRQQNLKITIDLSYATTLVWVSNHPLVMQVVQPLLSDALEVVAHGPEDCASYKLALDPEQLEDLLPPLLRGEVYGNYFLGEHGRKDDDDVDEDGSLIVEADDDENDHEGDDNASTDRAGKTVAAPRSLYSKPMSAGADPTSLAFVGSRPSMARHLLKHAERLLRVKAPALGGIGAPSTLVLAADPAGDRARLAKAALVARMGVARAEARAKGEAKEVALRLVCRERHLERHRLKLASLRRLARDELTPHSMFAEARAMSAEDDISQAARRYLACEWEEVKNLEAAFSDFDDNNSLSIDVGEFQDLMYALGHELSDDQAAWKVKHELDLDGSGAIEFGEFALWWLVHEEELGFHRGSLSQGSAASTATRLRLKIAYESRRRQRNQERRAVLAAGLGAGLGVGGGSGSGSGSSSISEGGGGGGGLFSKKKKKATELDPSKVLAAELRATRDKAFRSANAARLAGNTADYAVNTAMISRRGLTRAKGGAGGGGGGGGGGGV